MSNYVLDASAVLAVLNQEPGNNRVSDILGESVISAVNLSEAIAKLIEKKVPEPEIKLVLSYLNIEVMCLMRYQLYLAPVCVLLLVI